MQRSRPVALLVVLLLMLMMVGGGLAAAVLRGKGSERINMSLAEGRPQSPSTSDSKRPLTVYVASPLGFAASTQGFMNHELLPAIASTGVTAINPWEADGEVNRKIEQVKKINDLDKRRVAWRRVAELLGSTNARSIEKADGVVAVLDGVDVDSGTAAEIGYATALGKWVIGYRSDSRRTGEDETSEVNLQVEYFIRKNGGTIVHNLIDLEAELKGKNNARR